jgi:uncharacterized damage-inducible protein DinB
MTTSLLSAAFAHHIWTTERLIDECAALTPEQLTTSGPGTYGSIIDTLRHLAAPTADTCPSSAASRPRRPTRKRK